MTYLDFLLQDTVFCSSDYVVFSFTPYLQPECSKRQVPVAMETHSNNFTIKFVTDNMIENVGFLFRLSSPGNPIIYV